MQYLERLSEDISSTFGRDPGHRRLSRVPAPAKGAGVRSWMVSAEYNPKGSNKMCVYVCIYIYAYIDVYYLDRQIDRWIDR